MTHSLHRCGKLQEKDFVWLLYHVKGINDGNLLERVRKAIAMAEEVGAVNWGDVKSGPIVSVPTAEIKEKLTEKSRIRGVFTSRDQVTQFLKKMKEADLGLCVVISGLLDQVFPACQDAGVKPHTINYSLGVFGEKELMADEDTLAITTMCGHHMIPDEFVAENRRRVKEGKISPEKASLEFAAMCPCGIFNQERAKELLSLEKEGVQPKASSHRE
jgi:hypothetical protein